MDAKEYLESKNVEYPLSSMDILGCLDSIGVIELMESYYQAKIKELPNAPVSEEELKCGINITDNPPNKEYTVWIEINHIRYKSLPRFSKEAAEKDLEAIHNLVYGEKKIKQEVSMDEIIEIMEDYSVEGTMVDQMAINEHNWDIVAQAIHNLVYGEKKG